ncbi:MAG: hypothetical protein HXY23_14410 [Parvularculaceae bacterium]|nr:hypothetical protein [Parvularculaceae bacterium]
MTSERRQHLRQLSEAAERAARHKKWHWCRRENGFSDKPIWRVIAARLGLPLPQVLAFVNRLEEFANGASDRGGQRGSVGDFNPAEFAAALGMDEDDAARIFAALADPAVGWVSYDSVTDFHARNPDREDDTAADRVRRMRRRQRHMRAIAEMCAQGRMSAEERILVESQVLNDVDLSTAIGNVRCYDVTPRNIVTVTPEQSTRIASGAVDNSNAGARGGKAADQGADGWSNFPEPRVAPAEGSSTGGECYDVTPDSVDKSEAAEWLSSEGVRIVVARMAVTPQRAGVLIERWSRDLGDPMAMAAIVLGADNAELSGPRFHVSVSQQVARQVTALANGAPLPLGPVRLGPVAAGPLRAADEPVAAARPADDPAPIVSLPRKAAG